MLVLTWFPCSDDLAKASRGVACVFATRRRALVYILEEDEDEEEASDMD